jgi:hypothetical protein
MGKSSGKVSPSCLAVRFRLGKLVESEDSSKDRYRESRKHGGQNCNVITSPKMTEEIRDRYD